MLHEILATLLGIPGGIFVESPDFDEKCVSPLVPVSDHLPFVSPSELALSKCLLKLGNYYRILNAFVQQFRIPNQGIYTAAFANGLDEALDVYRQAVCELESDVLSSNDVGLSHFCYHLDTYQLILPVFVEIAQRVQAARLQSADGNVGGKGNSCGCRILDAILSSAPLGLSIPLLIFRTIFNRTLRVFYRQLYSWLLYGVLHDPYKEFFIDKTEGATASDGENNIDFYLVEDRIPELLSCKYAEHVLSIGQAIHSGMFGRAKKSFLSDLETKFSDRLMDLMKPVEINSEDSFDTNSEWRFDSMTLHKLVSDMYSFVSSRMWTTLVSEHGLIEFLHIVKDIMLLGRAELFTSFFDRLRVTTKLNHARFSQVDYDFMDLPTPSTAEDAKSFEYDITMDFMAAARSVALDDELLAERFRFKLALSSERADKSSMTVGDNLELHMLVPPIFRSVFSRHIYRGYSRLFSYLVNIRRTQLALQHCWAEQTSLWRQASGAVDPAALQHMVNSRLLVRSNMAFIVENLQYYLMVDVIESQFHHFIDRIKNDRQGQLIRVAQETFVASLQAQALLFHPTVNSLIPRLLSVCRQYAVLTSRSANRLQQGQSVGVEAEEEENLLRQFNHLSASLFHCLSRSHSSGANVSVGLDEGGHTLDSSRRSRTRARPVADLSQLLLRLDFNGFFSQTQGGWRTELKNEAEISAV